MSFSNLVSRRYKTLIKNIDIIEKNFLPSHRSNGSYTLEEQCKIRGYRLLVHAELESYFEDIAQKIAEESIRCWKTKKKSSNVVISIMSFSKAAEIGFPKKSNEKAEKFLDGRVDLGMSIFSTTINQNHGIKEENILNLLLPIGIDVQDLNQQWLNDMNSYAKERGLCAHKNIQIVGTQTTLDPIKEKKKVDEILIGIKKLNEKLSKLN